MSFTALSLPLVLLGLAAIAGALFLLQRLRVRHREVEVPTVLFWREAIEEARARVLVQRFRHPLSFLLFLLIASLLWLALAGPRSAAPTGREYVVLLDRSAAMAHAGRFEAALGAMREEIESLPRARTRVVDCGPYPRTLLAPGEDALLLDRRLAGVAPAPSVSTVATELWLAASAADLERGLDVVVCGDAPLERELLALLPEHVGVRRAGAAPEARKNRGITALGSSYARSLSWDRVDVFALIEGVSTADKVASTAVAFTLDGAPVEASLQREETSDSVRYFLRDLPAEGGLLHARLVPGDAFALDDEASLVLPERTPIRVALAPSLDRVLRGLLELDPAVLLSAERPDVIIRMAGEPALGDVPTLVLVSADTQQEAFLVRHTRGDEGHELTGVLETLGLTEIDVTELASEAARPIAVGMEPADVRGMSVWAELFSEGYDFTRSRAFPLFIAGGVRWLAGTGEPIPFVAAGEPVPARTALQTGPDGARLDPVGSAFVPPAAGTYAAPDAGTLAVSLLDPAATGAVSLGLEAREAPAPQSDGWDPTTWLGLIALALLGLEWILYRSGRVP